MTQEQESEILRTLLEDIHMLQLGYAEEINRNHVEEVTTLHARVARLRQTDIELMGWLSHLVCKPI